MSTRSTRRWHGPTIAAPYDFVRDYYKNVVTKADRFPEITTRWLDALKFVAGPYVLNIGCGPTLFDYIPHFGESPKVCTGIDINRATFDFLRRSRLPELSAARRLVKESSTDVRMVCDDVTKYIPKSDAPNGTYDTILAVGFLAGHHGLGFADMMHHIHSHLDYDGKLVVVSWNGPWRTDSEEVEKHLFRYEDTPYTDPVVLDYDITRAGFGLRYSEIINCTPEYGWDEIAVSVFHRI